MNVYAIKNDIEIFYNNIYDYEDIIIKLPQSFIDFRPDNNSWTIREHCTHIADKELKNLNELIYSLSKDCVIFNNDYISKIKFDHRNIYVILDIIRSTRSQIYRNIRWIQHENWNSTFIKTSNDTLTISSWLSLIKEYSETHLEEIKNNCQKANLFHTIQK